MIRPKACAVCGGIHWTGEGCTVPTVAPERQQAAMVLLTQSAVTHAGIEPVTHAGGEPGSRAARWRRNHPEHHAAQQRAYRARKRSAVTA